MDYEPKMKRIVNHILAMSLATILVLFAFGVAMPALSPIPAYAPNNDDDNNDNDDNDNNSNDNNNNDDELQFLIDVIECFINDNNNDNHDEHFFSDDVQDCIDNVIDDYFNNNHDNNNHHHNMANV
jgi:hypothetical protein